MDGGRSKISGAIAKGGNVRLFGHIPGVPIGTGFENRAALSAAGVHRPLIAGISGTPEEGADSVVLSGGYEDDADDGQIILYTGQGGNDPKTKKQVSNQTLARGNRAIARSAAAGLPIRVSRGASHRSSISPAYGYRDDGLYYVEDYWQERGRSGFQIWRFRLRQAEEVQAEEVQAEPPFLLGEDRRPYKAALRLPAMIQRIVRNTALSNRIKQEYDYTCQVCGIRLETAGGLYAEVAHIRPLGQPHNGPDSEDNILCLCPNHHVLFDFGAFTINDDLTLSGNIEGQLFVRPGRHPSLSHLAYRRTHYPELSL